MYTLRAICGEPGAEREHATVRVSVAPLASARTHRVFFNRGVAGSQGYSRRFGAQAPADVPDRAAFRWLSHGLEEALLAFIDAARDGDALRVAAYEFKYEPILLALKRAHERGVDVRIVVDW